ncbi:protein GRAVITROPIC IN THE LIGHT 1 [Euphorbia lathyris]|uniref:protein GRAVITROPIC IN THE LIGHT 1 n=1 Tax=Euphorbia lathyris TaxID=212925 RepID=UPI0033136CCC
MTEMMDTASPTTPKAPPISQMFQKFAIAFKTKTIEFFADETAADDYPSDIDGFSLLDSSEDFIPDQKVIILKPDQPLYQNSTPEKNLEEVPLQQPVVIKSPELTQIRPLNTQLAPPLISSVFATISSFEASYLQLQTSHVPFNVESIKSADEALVSHLNRLSDFKQLYLNLRRNPDFGDDVNIGSCLEAQVEENQSKLRVLGTVSDRLQEEIDRRDNEVSALRKKLNDLQRSNFKLSKRLSGNLKLNSSSDVLLSLRVFNSVLNDACRAASKFTKILIDLMRKAGWDLDLAAISVHSNIEYAKSGHNRYAFLSYVCLIMFRGFDSKQFGLDEAEPETETLCNDSVKVINNPLKQLLEHVSSSPVELISRNPQCQFSKFCENKYQELVHPTMESSIFAKLDRKEAVLSSWRSLSVFYESFVNMASSIWMLHKLAFSFDPVVEIFQVEKGADFSMVYMEDITRKSSLPVKTPTKIGFTVVPGFKIGRTVIQSQVYLCNLNCTD